MTQKKSETKLSQCNFLPHTKHCYLKLQHSILCLLTPGTTEKTSNHKRALKDYKLFQSSNCICSFERDFCFNWQNPLWTGDLTEALSNWSPSSRLYPALWDMLWPLCCSRTAHKTPRRFSIKKKNTVILYHTVSYIYIISQLPDLSMWVSSGFQK